MTHTFPLIISLANCTESATTEDWEMAGLAHVGAE